MAINNLTPGIDPAKSSALVAGNGEINKKVSGGGGLLNVILMIVLIGLVIAGTFFSFDKGSIMNRTVELEKETANLKVQIDNIKGQKVEVSKNASEALEKIKVAEIRWSEVIAEVNKLLPRDASGNRKVEVISYSGSDQGRVALNVVTQPAGIPPFDLVSGLIATFNNSVFFKDVYVPSISKGQTESGESTLSFVLNLAYEKPETGLVDLELATPVSASNAAATVKVPRNQ
jgi:hypothetical protein